MYDKISTFFYYGLCVKDLVAPDKEFQEELKKKRAEENQNKEEEIKAFTYGHVHFDG